MKTKKTTASEKKTAVVSKKTKSKAATKRLKKISLVAKKAAPKKKVVKKIAGKTKTMASGKIHKVSIQKKASSKCKVSFKRVVYVLLSYVLGLLTGLTVYGLIEIIYLKNLEQSGMMPSLYEGFGVFSFFPPIAGISFLAAGLLFGAWVGSWGWRKVYAERKH
jgi:hypothetical protein